MNKTKLILIFCVFYSVFLNAQLSHELGVIVGATSMQTDYGERGDYQSSFGNIGFGGGLVYYIGFKPSSIRWNDRGNWLMNHLKGKLEISYMTSKLVHYGKYAENSILLRSMTGSTKLINLGGQLEINIFNASDQRYLEPYFSIGGFYSIFDPDLESSLGNIEENINLIPSVYHGGIYLEKDTTTSFTFGAGTRYTLKNDLKMVFDFRWQRFFTNRIDGIEPQISADKYREWLLFLNIGIIFNLN